MVYLIFKFDTEKDLWNNWDTINYVSPWEKDVDFNKIPLLNDMCKGKPFEECEGSLRKFYEKMHKSPLIPEIVKSFQQNWDRINKEFFDRLKRITGNEFPFVEVKVYLTTQGRCPYDYNEGSFMVPLFSNIPYMLKTAGHELMHLDFHKNNWINIEMEIGKEKTGDLKEALTVLLNLEFRDLWIVKDEGKSSEEQQDLRDFIQKEWVKEKDYNLLLKKCVSYLKR